MKPSGTGQSSVSQRPSGHLRGIGVVIVLIAVGVVLGLVAVSYWQSRVPVDPSSESTSGDAKVAVFDPAVAAQEIEPLQQRFVEAVEARQRDLSPIVSAARRYVDRYPSFAPGHTLLGQILLQDGLTDQAYASFIHSLEIDGQQAEVHLLAGTIDFAADRFDRAEDHYSLAVGLEPSQTRYRLHLAQAQIRLNEFDTARRGLLEVLRLDSTSHEAYATLANLYADQNKSTLALNTIQKAIENTPVMLRDKQVAYIQYKAQLLRRSNQPQEALLTLQSLSPLEQGVPAVMKDLALCWAMIGKPQEAALLYERALAANPTQWQYAEAAARWRIKCNDHEAARDLVETVRKINPRAFALHELDELLSP